jgi:trigger factor
LKLKNSEKKEKNEVELVIEVQPEEVEAAVNKAYLKSRSRIAVPGFRKGKAPRGIIERMYGAEIFHSDTLDSLLPDALRFAMKESGFDTVGFPRVSDVDFVENNTRVEITVIAALHPEVSLGVYKGLKAPKPPVEVPDSEIDNEIESTRSRNARIEKADRAAAKGDIAVIDFEGFVDDVAFEGGKGENYELELGSGSFIPGFEDKVEGMVVGDLRDIDLVFPENYKEDLAGKPVVFKVRLNEVKEKILPELDDEFAKDVSEFDTLIEYKASIKEGVLSARQKDVDETFESILMEQLVDTMEVDVPDAMIEEQLERAMENFSRQMSAYGMEPTQYMQMLGTTPEVFRERMRDNSERQVKVSLALDKIAELEGVEVNEADLEEEYKVTAERYKTDVDKLKDSIPIDEIKRDIRLRKAARIVIDSAIIIDEPDGKNKNAEAAPKKKSSKSGSAATKKASPKHSERKS